MSKIIIDKNNIGFSVRDEIVLVEPYMENCVRIRSTRNNTILDEHWTVNDKKTVKFDITGNEENASLTVDSLRVEITKTWNSYALTFYKNNVEILKTKDEGDPVMKFLHTEGNNYRVRALFEAKDGEQFYGLGQEQQSYFDRKGGAYELCHYNTKSTVPFIYSSFGYGFLWNNPSPGHCELTNNHTLWQADSTYQVDYFIIAGDTTAEVMNNYCELTGYSPKLPEWAAGFWQCKLRYESQDDLLSVAREYKKRGIHVDAIVIDYFHWTEQGEWEFDTKYWHDPKSMCDELREMGIEPVVSIWPTINPKSKYYKEMNDRNMLVRTENGQYGVFDFYGQQTFVDMTNPNTRKFVWDKVKNNYYDYGIKTFWLDEAEPEVHPQQFSNLKFYNGNGAQTAMLYPYYYAKAFYDGLKSVGELEMVSLTRAAYIGSQKFGAIVWNGDIPSTFKALKESVVSGLSMAMCGIPWWNSDIGGFLWGDTESDYFRELIVRWFQFGVFSPIMRLHGVRQRQSYYKTKHEDIIEPSGGDNEIWSFGERNYPILKNLIELRERLKTYIIEQTNKTAKTGSPVMRPMFFDYYDDKICYTLSDQYMFGEDILFAPIVNEGQTERKVYLPKGKWVRTGDRAVFDGEQFVNCNAEIDEFIAFVKSGKKVINVF